MIRGATACADDPVLRIVADGTNEECTKAFTIDDYPDLLTVKHICEITGLSAQTIRAEINRGSISGCRIGRRLYVPKAHLTEYVMNRGGLDA